MLLHIFGLVESKDGCVTHRFSATQGWVGAVQHPWPPVVQGSTVYLGVELLEHRVCEYLIWKIVAVF